MSSVVWLSIDPVNCKINFYPALIATKIEKKFSETTDENNHINLGSDFYNATVHFHNSGHHYQTTPGHSMGRYGYKQPGYRSVRRIIVEEGSKVSLYVKTVYGEWRIAVDENDYDPIGLSSSKLLEETVPINTCVTSGCDHNIIKILPWTSEDLKSEALDVNVIVWEWCRATPEDGNVMLLPQKWWAPYNSDTTNAIENAFNENKSTIEIELPIIGKRIIEFEPNTCYASQFSEDKLKIRIIRRVTKTIQEVRQTFDNLSNPIYNFDIIVKDIPPGSIPHEFNCPILQNIMKDPVKTIDGFTYERSAIEKWFENSSKSPLTGLDLNNKELISNIDLKEMIEKFVSSYHK